MFCPYCKSPIAAGAESCPQCGANLKQIQQPVQPQQVVSQPVQPVSNNQYNVQPMSNTQTNNKKSPIVPILIVIIVVLLVVIAILGISLSKKSNSGTKCSVPEESNLTENNTTTNSGDTTGGNTTGTVDPNTNTTNDKTGAFLMAIEDVFSITGRGTVVTGKVERGTIKINDEVQIIGLDHEIITTTVTGIEMFRKDYDSAEAGDNVGLLLKNVDRQSVARGQVVAKPNSIKAATKFEATVDILSKEEGGRHTPFFNNYRPQFYFRTTDVTGVIELPKDVESVNPGTKNVKMTVELISNIAMEVGTKFAIREGGRTIGSGTVTKVY